MRDATEKFVGDAVAGALLLNGRAEGCLMADPPMTGSKLNNPVPPLVRNPGANS